EIMDSVKRKIVIDSIVRRTMEESQTYRFIVVSRPLPESDIRALSNPTLEVYRIKPFDSSQFSAYAKAWFAHRSAQTAAVDSAEFLKLVERSRIQSLVSLPLLGTI